MSAYVLAQIQIDEPDEYQNYLAGFMPIFERHGGDLRQEPPLRLYSLTSAFGANWPLSKRALPVNVQMGMVIAG